MAIRSSSSRRFCAIDSGHARALSRSRHDSEKRRIHLRGIHFMKTFFLETCYLAGLFLILSALILLAEQLESPLTTMAFFALSIYTMVLIMVRFGSSEKPSVPSKDKPVSPDAAATRSQASISPSHTSARQAQVSARQAQVSVRQVQDSARRAQVSVRQVQDSDNSPHTSTSGNIGADG